MALGERNDKALSLSFCRQATVVPRIDGQALECDWGNSARCAGPIVGTWEERESQAMQVRTASRRTDCRAMVGGSSSC